MEDITYLHELKTVEALRNYGLLIFFKTQGMMKKVLLLEHLINMWDGNDQVFHVGPHILCIDI